uniref:Cilia and flagella associated protein 43 n=1 Tax=Molossus molossus TaxID=27622 RepID=A0A7J8DND1_MOLMO|nr:cilia and flagella associated protein 43 [Molossus molossus]
MASVVKCPTFAAIFFLKRNIVVFAFLSHTRKCRADYMDLEHSLCLRMDCGS